MNAAEVLRTAQGRGLHLRAAGDRLRIRPADALDPNLRAQLLRFKPEVLPMVRVLDALDYGPMRRAELMRETGLDLGDLYGALGNLYDAGMVKTDPEGWYFLLPQYTRPTRTEDMCPHCRRDDAQGVQVLACRVCDRRIN